MNRCTEWHRPRGPALTLVPLLLVCALFLAGCQSQASDTTGQKSDGFPAPSKEMVFQASMKALIESGYTPDYDQSSERTGWIQSRWRTELQPFSGTGRRDKVSIQVHEVPDHASYFRVETNVVREQNMNVKNPSDPVFAEWKNGQRVPEVENLITRRIEMSFLPGDASDEWLRGQRFPGRSPRLRDLDPKPKKEDKNDPLGLGIGLPPIDIPTVK